MEYGHFRGLLAVFAAPTAYEDDAVEEHTVCGGTIFGVVLVCNLACFASLVLDVVCILVLCAARALLLSLELSSALSCCFVSFSLSVLLLFDYDGAQLAMLLWAVAFLAAALASVPGLAQPLAIPHLISGPRLRLCLVPRPVEDHHLLVRVEVVQDELARHCSVRACSKAMVGFAPHSSPPMPPLSPALDRAAVNKISPSRLKLTARAQILQNGYLFARLTSTSPIYEVHPSLPKHDTS